MDALDMGQKVQKWTFHAWSVEQPSDLWFLCCISFSYEKIKKSQTNPTVGGAAGAEKPTFHQWSVWQTLQILVTYAIH